MAKPISRPTTTRCTPGTTVGNFSIVLNCEGNDSDGTSSYESVPDTDLAVGDQYFIQTVDNVFTIFNKADGSIALGPAPLTTFWTTSTINRGAPNSGDDFHHPLRQSCVPMIDVRWSPQKLAAKSSNRLWHNPQPGIIPTKSACKIDSSEDCFNEQ